MPLHARYAGLSCHRCKLTGIEESAAKTDAVAHSQPPSPLYAAFFFPARIVAQRARCAAAILARADADMVRFTGAEDFVFAVPGCDPFRAFAHLAFCASAILRRDAADMIRFGWFVFRNVPEPFNDSMTEIA